LTDSAGNRRDVLLGRHNTPESKAAYFRVVQEWEARGRRLPDREAGTGLRVNELLERFLDFAERHYCRPDGTQTAEVANFKHSIRTVREMYGLQPATAFGPLALKAVRERMVSAGLCRGVTNQRCQRIVRAFKWAVSEELIPESVWRALTTVRGLERGRTQAREPEPVGPVSEAAVEAVLPHLSPTVTAMVQLQRLTGMRPGEVCRVKASDIDMSGSVWLFRPPAHKTAHRGRARVVALGPKAVAIVKQFLTLDTQAFLFSPRRAMETCRVARRALRKSKVQPSQRDRRKRDPGRPPRDVYTAVSYARAVNRGCDRAFPPPAPLGRADGETVKEWRTRLTVGQREELQAWRTAHRWHPNMLRHSHATEVRRLYGLEAAQVSLGHSTAAVSQIYAERDQALAAKVAAAIG
jgi:integrase